jgi:glycosyltransferase involved in cell wall biosynthesis
MSMPLIAWPEPATVGPAPATQSAPAALDQRILVVVRWPVGGIRTHLQYTYPFLGECGWRFTFVGPDDSLDGLARTLRGLDGCEYVGVPVRGSRCPLWSTARELLRSGRFGLLHSHGLTAVVHAAGANFGFGLPHLATLHDVFRPVHFRGCRAWLKRWLLARVLRRLSAVVAVGADVRANLLEYFPRLARGPCRVVTIPNGIDTGHYRPAGKPDGSLRQRLGLAPTTCVVGFLGRFMEQKGFSPWLLEALRQVKAAGTPRPFHLVAVGSGDCRRRYEREIAHRGLADVVTVLDFVPDVLPILRQLDLLVIPSLWEASPLVPMEALAVGVPVLGSDCIGLREVLRDTPARMVPVGDVAALALGLTEAVARPWTTEATAYAPLARARFDNTHSARQLAQLLADLAVLPGRSDFRSSDC